MCTNKVISYASIEAREETLSAVTSIKYINNTEEKHSVAFPEASEYWWVERGKQGYWALPMRRKRPLSGRKPVSIAPLHALSVQSVIVP